MKKKPRVLITLPKINKLGGATVVSLELAEYFNQIGGKATIYASTYEYPARKYFEDRRVHVEVFDDKPNFRLSDFDYVFVNSQILPISMISQLAGSRKFKKMPLFLYLHKSPLESIPDEHPWLCGLEDKMADNILFISEKTRDSNEPMLDKNIPRAFFRNPAPIMPDKYIYGGDALKKALILSNHPPHELEEAARMLREKGIEVDFLGEKSKSDIVSYDLLSKYNLIITIGKSVQYCLCMGVPVYVYDHFGGYGYLNKEVFSHARMNNFSGRFTEKKSSEKICKEIISGYDEALSFHAENRLVFYDEFNISNVIPKLLSETKPRGEKRLNETYARQVIYSMNLIANYFKVFAERDRLLDEVGGLRNEVEQIKQSRTWRIGSFFVKPFSKLKRLFSYLRTRL